MQQDSILRSLGVYGWDHIETPIIASIAGGFTTLLLGETGVGKTHSHKRIAWALAIAGRAKGLEPLLEGDPSYKATKLDGAAAQEDDLIGYLMPPSHQEMYDAMSKGDPIFMNTVFNRNGIGFSRTILVDEATRIPDHMQNKYLPMLDEHREVSGYKLPAEFIWGSANPLGYAGTYPMDRALAGRWALIIPTPSLSQLAKEDRLRIIAVKRKKEMAIPPSESDSLRFWDMIEDTRKKAAMVSSSVGDSIDEYVDAMIDTINKSIEGAQNDGSTTLTTIDGRRATTMSQNIVYVHAASQARGGPFSLPDEALETFKMSLNYQLTEEGHMAAKFLPAKIKAAHETHKVLLESEEDKILSKIQQEPNAIKRVNMAFKLGANARARSAFVQQAYEEEKKRGAASAATFSYAFMAAYMQTDESMKVDRHILDPMVSEVIAILRARDQLVLKTPTLSISDNVAIDRFRNLVATIDKLQQSPVGRASFGIVALMSKEKSLKDASSMAALESLLVHHSTDLQRVSKLIGTLS